MVENIEEVSPASRPVNVFEWTEERSCSNTTLINEKTIRFNNSGSFRFERVSCEVIGESCLDLRIRYTNSSYNYCCLGLTCESEFNGNKGSYYFDKSIMYSKYYPKVTQNTTDLPYTSFTVNDKDTVSIRINLDEGFIEFIHNEKPLGEAKITVNSNENWFYIVGMFEGEIDILN